MRHVAPEEEKLARAIAEHHVPALARAQFDPLPTSEGNRAYLLNGGPRYRFIVRLVEEAKVHKLKDEMAALEVMTAGGLPVPELVAHDLGKSRFPVLYRMVRFLEGYDFEEGISTGRIPEEEEENLARHFGELVARLHAITGTPIGKLGTADQPAAQEDWAKFVATLADQHLRQARQLGLVDAAKERALASLFEREVARLGPRLRAELTHRDLYLGNVIVDEEGIGYHLSGLIDVEHARFWDRLWDFAKLQWLVFDRHPSLAAPFLEAYESTFPRPPDFEARTHLYRAVEALISITFFAPMDATRTRFFQRVLEHEISRAVP